MAYNTKVVLIAIGEIVRKAGSVEEVYEAVKTMANAEGVLLKPFRPKDDEGGNDNGNNA